MVFDLEEQNKNLAGKIVVSFEKIAEIFRVMLWEKSKVHGLSPIQIQLLIFLKTHRPEMANVSYLAEEFNLTKPTVSDAISALKQKGLLSKLKDSNDSRFVHLALTAKGVNAVNELISFSHDLERAVLTLDIEQQKNLWNNLFPILVSLQQTNLISVQRMCLNCSYYRTPANAGHYCAFLNKELQTTDLRLDCPEHQTA